MGQTPPLPQWANLGPHVVKLNQYRYLMYFQPNFHVGILYEHCVCIFCICGVCLKNQVQSRSAIANKSKTMVRNPVGLLNFVIELGDGNDNNDGDGDDDQITNMNIQR